MPKTTQTAWYLRGKENPTVEDVFEFLEEQARAWEMTKDFAWQVLLVAVKHRPGEADAVDMKLTKEKKLEASVFASSEPKTLDAREVGCVMESDDGMTRTCFSQFQTLGSVPETVELQLQTGLKLTCLSLELNPCLSLDVVAACLPRTLTSLALGGVCNSSERPGSPVARFLKDSTRLAAISLVATPLKEVDCISISRAGPYPWVKQLKLSHCQTVEPSGLRRLLDSFPSLAVCEVKGILSHVTEDNEPTLGKHPSVTDLNYLDSKCWNSTCIFLIESSGRNYILPRYQCAIEAAARHHPHRPIILLTAAYQDREQRPLQEILNAFPNIHVVPANFQDFLQGTQLQDLYLRMKSSKYLYVHLADIWRVGVLYRYGGIYIDLDLITLQNYDQLPDGLPVYKGTDNVMESIRGHLFWLTGLDIASLSLERKERLLFVTNSFMKFSKQKHNLLSKYFQKISSTTVNLHCYWCVGPHAMSNVVMRWCPSAVSEVNQFTNCSLEDELFVYPEKTVHPIPWFEMKKVFSAIQEDTEEVVDKIFDKSAFAFHISNHAFKWGDIWYLQNTAYSIVALKECPVAHRYLLSTRHL
ncbi:unnamed protein product [Cyprideis torosa]|uniref:Uncharacterized protein n=1 Tax=Cyprideis torosa TaxID=163714 RepID=A0A7R8WDM2_9CRUS|nr:unnamed protein product [Cyprideis torosa]CAG0888727.1 unnamed protein product [Cyprideis torosa]